MRRSWSIPPSRLRRATVPQFNMVASLRSHRTALRLPGVPWLRTVLRSVCSPLQPFGPPPFAKRSCDAPCFIGLTAACFAHCARPSCAPFGTKGRLLGRATSYGGATSQKAPLVPGDARSARIVRSFTPSELGILARGYGPVFHLARVRQSGRGHAFHPS